MLRPSFFLIPWLLASEFATSGSAIALEENLLRLLVRSEEERAGDFDALLARWLEAVERLGRSEKDSSPIAEGELLLPGGPLAPGGPEACRVPDSLVLEGILRRILDIRSSAADPGKLIPKAEAAFKLHYRDGLYRQILRGFLADLYRRAGREEWLDLRKGDGSIRRWAVIGPFGIGGQSQMRRSFPPEGGIDPKASCRGRKGPVSWRVPPRSDLASPWIEPSNWIYPHDGVVYLFFEAPALNPEGTPAVLHVGTPEPVSLWVNGRAAWKEDPGPSRPERRAIPVNLAEGRNRILLKTIARPGSWLWARLTDPRGDPWDLPLDSPLDEGSPGNLVLRDAPERDLDPISRTPYRTGASKAWEEIVVEMARRGVPAVEEADARIGLALLFAATGEDEKAVLHAERALALRPDDAPVQAHAGKVFLEARYFPKDHGRSRARTALEAARTRDADFLPAYIPLARFLSEDNEKERAARLLAEALARRPGSHAARLELLKLFADWGWHSEAREAAEALEAQSPRSPSPALYRFRRFRELGNPRRALEEAEKALSLDRSLKILGETARLRLEVGDAPRAEADLLARLRSPDLEDIGASLALAEFYRDRREWEKAISVLKDLDARNPADPDPSRRIGLVHEEAGRIDEAIPWYERALAREPGDIDLDRRLRRLKKDGPREEFWSAFDEDLASVLPGLPAADPKSGSMAQAILDIAVLKLYPDGSTSEYVHQAFRILSEEGKEEFAKVQTPGEVVRIRTISAEGRTLEPIPATGKEEFTLPALMPGAYAEWAFRDDRPRSGGRMLQGSSFYFQDFTFRKPFLLSRYVVLLPLGLPVDLVERAMEKVEGRAMERSPAVAKVRKEEKALPGGGRAVVYEARDAFRLERELGMPFREDYIPNVQVLEKWTWDDVSSRIEDRVLGLTRWSGEIEGALAEALKGCRDDPADKVRAIYAYVNDLVAETSGPSEAVRVLITRSGDRTVLFKALLERAGIQSRWAFARRPDSLIPFDDGSHPEPDPFTARFVLVDQPSSGGGEASGGSRGVSPDWISLALRRAPFGKLPVEIQGGLAMVLEPSGGSAFLPVPFQPLEESASSALAELLLSGADIPDLAAKVKVDLLSRGVEVSDAKDRLRTLKEDLKKQAVSAAASRLFPGARVQGMDFPGLGDPEAPLCLRFEGTAPKVLVPGEGGDVLIRTVLQPAELVKRLIRRARREHPYRLGQHILIRDRIRIFTGPGFRIVRIPETSSQASGIGTYSLNYTFEGPDGSGGERLLVERNITLLPILIPAEEFPRIVEFSKAVDQAEEERLVLRRTGPGGK